MDRAQMAYYMLMRGGIAAEALRTYRGSRRPRTQGADRSQCGGEPAHRNSPQSSEGRMTRGLATAGFVVVLAFTLVGQAFAVSGDRDNDAALRAMMDDAPHRPAKGPSIAHGSSQGHCSSRASGRAGTGGCSGPGCSTRGPEGRGGGRGSGRRSASRSPSRSRACIRETAAEEETAPQAEAEASAEAPAEAAEAPAEAEAAAKEAPPEGSWLSRLLPSVFGGGEAAKTEAPAEGAVEGAAPNEEAAPAEAAAEHSEAAAEASHEAPAGEGEASSEAPAADGHEASAEPRDPCRRSGEHAAKEDAAAQPEAQKDAESGGGWMSYIPFFGSSSKTAEAPAADTPAEGGEAHEAKPEGSEGEHAAAEGEAQAAGGEHGRRRGSCPCG